MIKKEFKCPYCGEKLVVDNCIVDDKTMYCILHNDIDAAINAKCPMEIGCYETREDAEMACDMWRNVCNKSDEPLKDIYDLAYINAYINISGRTEQERILLDDIMEAIERYYKES